MALTVWINAFIPLTVPGYTVLIPAGQHRGKTAVPLPGVARMNPLNLLKPPDTGYLTDQRTFSPMQNASCRMQSLADLSLAPTPTLSRQAHTTSGTTEVNVVTGAQLNFGNAVMTKCVFSNVSVSATKTIISVDVSGAASDPLVSAAAKITYEGRFIVTLQPASSGAGRTIVAFSGKIDVFPAFEAYAQLGGVTKMLFTSPPPPGNTVVDLAKHFGPTRPVAGSVTF